jgi:hypothetical protein
MGVLASADVVGPSESWYGESDVQRLLVCDPEPDGPIGEASDDNAIPILNEAYRQYNENDPGSNVTYVSGTCSQRQSDAASITATILPTNGSSNHHGIGVVVTLTNAGDDPIAVFRDSITLSFELPWGALSDLHPSREGTFFLGGSTINTSPLDFASIQSTNMIILEPGEELSVSISAHILSGRVFDEILADPASGVTPEMIEEYKRAVSSIGELSEEDPIIPAFGTGEFIPRAGVLIVVAPSDPLSTQVVALMVVSRQVGEPPSALGASPAPSASPSV